MKKLILTLAAASFVAAASADKPKNVNDIRETISDQAIIFPESFEADTQKMLEGWYLKNYTATDDRYETASDPGASDELIIKRLKALPTVIEMPFNSIVRSYIDRYTRLGRKQVAVLLGLSNYYMPIFEQTLEEMGLPLELKYLPVIESGLDPNAVSKHGATGLWQIMIGTARGLDMEVSSLVDERRDPYVSSRKAAGYLRDIYSTYGDWTLAIAAYNCGPGAVNKAIRRAGGDPKSHDFWSIYQYLSPETRGYVPMFIAANYVMNYYPEHNISPVLSTKPLVTDTISIHERIHFNQISDVLSIPVDELRVLNPQFRADIIPGDPAKSYNLILPSQQIHAYILSEDEIRSHDAEKYARRETAEPGIAARNDEMVAEAQAADDRQAEADVEMVRQTAAANASADAGKSSQSSSTSSKGSERIISHKVAAGETIASIAGNYGVSVAQIKDWNNLRRNAVRTGQQLRILTDAPLAQGDRLLSADAAPARQDNSSYAAAQPAKQTAAASSSRQKKASKAKQQAAPKSTSHTIKAGESLSSISKKYGVSVEELRKANGISGDNIRAGKSLKIPGKASSGKKKSKSRKKRRR